MMRRLNTCSLIVIVALAALSPPAAQADDNKADAGKKADRDDLFKPMDVFQIEHASDPRISPDGKQVIYVRNMMDVMKDRRRSNLWIINVDGSEHRPLTTGKHNDSMPRWSPDGKRLVYFSTADGTPQLYCRWMDSGQVAKLTDCTSAPVNPVWSPDGKFVAFTMAVADEGKPFVAMPAKPEGAEWSGAPKVIRKSSTGLTAQATSRMSTRKFL